MIGGRRKATHWAFMDLWTVQGSLYAYGWEDAALAGLREKLRIDPIDPRIVASLPTGLSVADVGQLDWSCFTADERLP